MESVIWILVGLAAGAVANVVVFRSIPRTPWTWTGALLVGLVGGWLGGLLTDVIGLEAVNWLGAFVIALVGAILLLLLLRRMLPNRV